MSVQQSESLHETPSEFESRVEQWMVESGPQQQQQAPDPNNGLKIGFLVSPST